MWPEMAMLYRLIELAYARVDFRDGRRVAVYCETESGSQFACTKLVHFYGRK